jgi:hypothetical protein
MHRAKSATLTWALYAHAAMSSRARIVRCMVATVCNLRIGPEDNRGKA